MNTNVIFYYERLALCVILYCQIKLSASQISIFLLLLLDVLSVTGAVIRGRMAMREWLKISILINDACLSAAGIDILLEYESNQVEKQYEFSPSFDNFVF